MSLYKKLAAFALLLLGIFQLVLADTQVPDATPDQLDKIKNLIVSVTKYYRSLNNASPLEWNDTLAGISDAQAMNCTLQYDIFNEGDRGQMVFKVGMENGSFPDIVQGTDLAMQYWWEERKMYHPKSSDYDDLSKFSDSWEFTQMVWKSSKQIGCGWSYGLCEVPADEQDVNGHLLKTVAQLVCNLVPAGNQWEQFGANVECKADGCTYIQPQTNTIDTKTISWPSDLSKRAEPTKTEPSAPFVTPETYRTTAQELAAAKAQMDEAREMIKHLSPEDFAPGFIPNVQNRGKLMANEGHEGMVAAGYDAKYFEEVHQLIDTTAVINKA